MTSASAIRMIVSDVDGVWTDGKIIYLGDQHEIKEFNVRDGLGVKLAQKGGIPVALITSRRSPSLERRAAELGIAELHQGSGDKLEALKQLATRLGIRLDEILYVGDDLPDLAPMMQAGIAAAPADAVAEVLAVAQWKLTARGGQGAIRELIERLLRERGAWDQLLEGFAGGKPEVQGI
jgi:3-deoxy-D-manno-octulosonate 8-phosphate phosphatase (KDO 8-P phosphatase)